MVHGGRKRTRGPASARDAVRWKLFGQTGAGRSGASSQHLAAGPQPAIELAPHGLRCRPHDLISLHDVLAATKPHDDLHMASNPYAPGTLPVTLEDAFVKVRFTRCTATLYSHLTLAQVSFEEIDNKADDAMSDPVLGSWIKNCT
jgi:hypothetical protein